MKIPFPASVEKDGRIKIPSKVLRMFGIKSKDFLFVEIEKYTETTRDVVADAFTEGLR